VSSLERFVRSWTDDIISGLLLRVNAASWRKLANTRINDVLT